MSFVNWSQPRNGVLAEQTDVLICGCGSNLERGAGLFENSQAGRVQSEDLLKETYHVPEVAFWAEVGEGIERSHYASDTKPTKTNGLLIEETQRGSRSAAIEYGCGVQRVEVEDYCVTARATFNGQQKIFQSKYMLAYDGAHSTAHKSLGIAMVGDSANAIWGVMYNAIIYSRAGNIMIIPHKGNFMVRFYVELGDVAGMNVSLQVGYNIGYKLASVLRILEKYASGRQQIAAQLIDCDRCFAKSFSSSHRQEDGTSFRGIIVRMRFPSAQVVRLCDARSMPLVTALLADS
ncbi:FAD binding domain-containing protein [Trichoderma austrokoningii]